MNYFIVFQNKTYFTEKEGEYLWAPQKNTLNKPLFHWDNMKKLNSGDIVFSMYKQQLVSVNRVKTKAVEETNPFKDSDNSWGEKGWISKLSYDELANPILMMEVIEKVLALCPEKYSPFSRKGKGNQGYLYEISEGLGEYLLQIVRSKNDISV